AFRLESFWWIIKKETWRTFGGLLACLIQNRAACG
ncbi:hypothetical protein Pgy4_41399, partial [Pseudomonas savastanoi pv. glycinea str. race 4]